MRNYRYSGPASAAVTGLEPPTPLTSRPLPSVPLPVGDPDLLRPNPPATTVTPHLPPLPEGPPPTAEKANSVLTDIHAKLTAAYVKGAAAIAAIATTASGGASTVPIVDLRITASYGHGLHGQLRR